MAKEYIERSIAITLADYAADEHPYTKQAGKPETYSDYNRGWNDACDYIRERLEGVPTADVAPVVHGRFEWREKWDIDEPNHMSTLEYCGWYCSHCGIELGEYMTTRTDEKHYLDNDIREPLLNCCPNCGARMDGEGEVNAAK